VLFRSSVNSGSFTLAAKIISVIFDTTAMVALSIVVAACLFILHRKHFGVLLLAAMLGDALLVSAFKAIIMSPRPANEIISEVGYSFPSGHTMGCVVFFGIITYFTWKSWGSTKVKAGSSILYVSITALVGFDRIYLNVHWFSDLVGSIFLGGFWLTFCILVFQSNVSSRLSRFKKKQFSPKNGLLRFEKSKT
jgi:undecaprenyl-diphosphatase